MQRVDFSDRVDGAPAARFVAIVLARLAYGVVWVRRARASPTEEASPMPRRLSTSSA